MNTKDLKLKANGIRQSIISMLNSAGSGHTAGAMGLAELFSVLYFSKLMNYNAKKPQWDKRDYLFLSNGHTNPVLYATLAEAGFFNKEELLTLRKLGSRLQGHPHYSKAANSDWANGKQSADSFQLPGVENSGGPLGQGISQAIGLAACLKRDKKSNKVFCVVGDGEMQEGQVWEALMWAKKEELDNFILLIDNNNIQIDGRVNEVMPGFNLHKKLVAFGCSTIDVNGHDVTQIYHGLQHAFNISHPVAILLKTIPGKGVSFMENKVLWHGKAPNDEEFILAKQELEQQRRVIESE